MNEMAIRRGERNPGTITDASRNAVLVVDDDADARQILAFYVHSVGLRPIFATEGVEALSVLNDGSAEICLILLDLMMPGMSGFTVLARIRSEVTLRRIPVIVVTALGAESLNLLKQPGVVDVWQKGELTPADAQVALRKYATRDSLLDVSKQQGA